MIKKKKKLFLLIFILILVLGFFLLFSFKTFNKYKNWNEHKDYFKQDKSKQKIEGWMTLRFIGNEYEIDLKKRFNESSFSFSQKRMTLNEYCYKNNFDCEFIIKELNEDLTEMRKSVKIKNNQIITNGK